MQHVSGADKWTGSTGMTVLFIVFKGKKGKKEEEEDKLLFCTKILDWSC